MDKLEAFELACQEAGGVTKLAERMSQVSGKDYKQARLSNWKSTGVPPESVIDVSQAVGFRVTPHQLRDDIYRHPQDSVPENIRANIRHPDQAAA